MVDSILHMFQQMSDSHQGDLLRTLTNLHTAGEAKALQRSQSESPAEAKVSSLPSVHPASKEAKPAHAKDKKLKDKKQSSKEKSDSKESSVQPAEKPQDAWLFIMAVSVCVASAAIITGSYESKGYNENFDTNNPLS